MANWKTRTLTTLRKHLAQGTVQFTEKAKNELAALDLYELDAVEIMSDLTAGDLVDRIQSTSSGEPLYVFKTQVDDRRIYIKFALRNFCDVISFHPDSGEENDGKE